MVDGEGSPEKVLVGNSSLFGDRVWTQNEALRYVTLRVVTTVLKRDFLIYRKHGLPNFQFY